jgi:uncharacterized protein YqfA (UPF0365 family)
MNDGPVQASGRIQQVRRNFSVTIGAFRIGADKNKENTMLRNFAAAVLAATLIAGTAYAAQPAAGADATPSASVGANVKTKHANAHKTVRHVRTHVRKHIARGKVETIKLAKHLKSTKTHHHHVVSHVAKPQA